MRLRSRSVGDWLLPCLMFCLGLSDSVFESATEGLDGGDPEDEISKK